MSFHPPALLNQKLKDFLAFDTPPERLAKVINRVVHSPYLTLSTGFKTSVSAEVVQGINTRVNRDGGLLRTPFKNYRFSISPESGPELLGYVDTTSTTFKLLFFEQLEVLERPYVFILTLTATGEKMRYTYRVFSRRTGAEVTHAFATKKATSEVLTDFVDGVTFVMRILCHEYLLPSNFVAKVTPNTPGKSVEWKQAREHFTVIHRHHPANSAAVVSGATVEPSEKQLNRIAHSRRAHYRMLRSERYVYKRGISVPVRSTWCGPKEWQDTAGQTYRIIPNFCEIGID